MKRRETVEIVLGTKNKGKMAEFRELLKGVPIRVRLLSDFPQIPVVAEDGRSFLENAEHKAKAYAKAAGMIAVAEDSGLEVDYLGGEPGIRSARFAGEHATDRENIGKLLTLMEAVPWSQRSARFVCVICIADPEGRTAFAQGSCEGTLSFEMKGTHGFGYDPIFVPRGFTMTMAEMKPRLKNSISHRAAAIRAFGKVLEDFLSLKDSAH